MAKVEIGGRNVEGREHVAYNESRESWTVLVAVHVVVEQGVHRYVHEFCAIHHRSASGSGFSPLHESYGIHTLVLLTVL